MDIAPFWHQQEAEKCVSDKASHWQPGCPQRHIFKEKLKFNSTKIANNSSVRATFFSEACCYTSCVAESNTCS